MSPIFDRARKAEQARALMNAHRSALGLRPHHGACEFNLTITDGAFVIIQKPIPYEIFLPSRESAFPERSGRGMKDYRDVIFFDSAKVRPNYDDELPDTEIEIVEYQRDAPQDLRYKTPYNLVRIKPAEHLIGFLEMNNPQVIVEE